MKSLGIVRKIDHLGRIVIPKEVRDTHNWNPGQPMEMFMSEDGLVVRPYKTEMDKQEIIEELTSVLSYTNNKEVSSIISKAIKFVEKG